MRNTFLVIAVALPVLSGLPALGGAPVLTPADTTVGRNLQTYATVALSEPAASDVQLVLTSSDPKRLLLSKTPDVAGTPSITIVVRARFRESPEFWLHALDEAGKVQYTASAPGYVAGAGTVTLTPSGIVIIGPYGAAAPEFPTTPRGWPMKITLHAARLDSSLKYVQMQYVRGGMTVEIHLSSSDPAVGTIVEPVLTIGPAADTAITQFKPKGVGKTTLSVSAPPGFRTPAALNSVLANVKVPGMAVATDMTIGENLQVGAALSLGEPAPEGGLTVTLTSSSPDKLLISASPTEVGKPSTTVTLPAGAVSTTYFLQALTSAGAVTHTATASGYTTRTGTLMLAPSGVIISLRDHGPPDEAEVFRPLSAGKSQNLFVAMLSAGRPTPLVLYTAYLDPTTHRSADITVQPLRAGLSLAVGVKNADPGVGEVDSHVTINGGSDRGLITFKPLSVGKTIISVVKPDGFTQPTNATELLGIVRE